MNLAGSPSGLGMSPDVGVQSFYGNSSSLCWCRLVKGILLTAVWDRPIHHSLPQLHTSCPGRATPCAWRRSTASRAQRPPREPPTRRSPSPLGPGVRPPREPGPLRAGERLPPPPRPYTLPGLPHCIPPEHPYTLQPLHINHNRCQRRSKLASLQEMKRAQKSPTPVTPTGSRLPFRRPSGRGCGYR